MTRYDIDRGIPTLAAALSEHMNADELEGARQADEDLRANAEGRARGAHLQVLQGRSAARHVAGFRRPPEGGRRGGRPPPGYSLPCPGQKPRRSDFLVPPTHGEGVCLALASRAAAIMIAVGESRQRREPEPPHDPVGLASRGE
jgi:hypothetical protein